jgi:hypothetical protein
MTKMGKRAKRLTRLKIHEVSVCDAGAGRGVRIALMKRAGKSRPRFVFNGADSLVPNVDDSWTKPTVAKALEEIEANRRLLNSAGLAKATPPAMEHHNMGIETVAKAAITKMDSTIEDLMRDPAIKSRASALLKISSSAAHAETWRAYRAAMQLSTAEEPETAAPMTVSPAYAKMMKKAAKLRENEPGLSQASAFAKIYAARPDLAQEDKAYFFNKGVGSQFTDGSYALDQLLRALRASYPELSEAKIRRLAQQLQAKAPPMAELTSGYGA